MVKRLHSLCCHLLFWAAMLFSANTLATLSAQVDRQTITENDTVTLVLRLDEQAGFSSPDLTALEQDFNVLSQQRSNQFRSFNGRTESFTEWRIMMTPKKLGQVVIPSVSYKQQRSAPVLITVNPLSDAAKEQIAKQFFFVTSVDKPSAYVQEQIIYTEKLYYSVNHEDARLSEVRVADGSVQALGEMRQYMTKIDGKRMGVYERRYAILPEESGELVIPGTQFSAQQGNRYDRRSRAPVQITSQPIRIDIKPIPSAFPKNSPWLVSSEVKLVQTLSHQADKWVAGEPVTMTLTLVANGLVGNQLPAIALPAVDGLKYYPDQNKTDQAITEQGIQGTREQSLAIVPTQQGRVRFPKLSVPWWNSKTEQLEYATVPAFSVNVGANPNAASSNSASKPSIKSPAMSQPNAKRVTTIPQPTSTGSNAQHPNTHERSNVWIWIALVAVLLLVISNGVLAWLLVRNKQQTTHAPKQNDATTRSVSIRHVEAAAKQKDIVRLRLALIAWGNALLGEGSITQLNELPEKLHQPELADLLTSIDDALFSNTQNAPVDVNAIVRLVKSTKAPKRMAASSHLPPLYQ